MMRRGFVPMLVPHLVKDEAMIGTAYFPGGEEQAYRIEKDAVNLIGTAEVPLTAYHYDERTRHTRPLPHPPVSQGGAGNYLRGR
jgi:seryl-tRNA synthetase